MLACNASGLTALSLRDFEPEQLNGGAQIPLLAQHGFGLRKQSLHLLEIATDDGVMDGHAIWRNDGRRDSLLIACPRSFKSSLMANASPSQAPAPEISECVLLKPLSIDAKQIFIQQHIGRWRIRHRPNENLRQESQIVGTRL